MFIDGLIERFKVRAMVSSARPPAAAIVLFTVIAAFGVLGYLEDTHSGLSLFDLDGEGKPPAAFSALLLGGAGVLSGALHVHEQRRRRWLFMGGFFLFMASDEALTVHETAGSLTGVEWPVLYLPIILVGGVAWLLVLQVLWRQGQRGCVAAWCTGAFAWVIAVVLEIVASDPETGRVANYSVLATMEECLEMTGNALWLLTLLVALRSVLLPVERLSGAGRRPARQADVGHLG